MTTKSILAALALTTFALPAYASDLIVYDPFARATPPGAQVGGAFLTLHNHGDPTRLVGARSDAAALVQIHTHTIDEAGIMRMREVEEGIALGTHSTVTLAPGGLHIMLMNLNGPLKEGEEVDITLEFDNGKTVDVSVPIKSIAAGGTADHSGHGDHSSHGEKHKH